MFVISAVTTDDRAVCILLHTLQHNTCGFNKCFSLLYWFFFLV